MWKFTLLLSCLALASLSLAKPASTPCPKVFITTTSIDCPPLQTADSCPVAKCRVPTINVPCECSKTLETTTQYATCATSCPALCQGLTPVVNSKSCSTTQQPPTPTLPTACPTITMSEGKPCPSDLSTCQRPMCLRMETLTVTQGCGCQTVATAYNCAKGCSDLKDCPVTYSTVTETCPTMK